MNKNQTKPAASAPAEFLPTHGGVYHVDNGVVTVLEGGLAAKPAIEPATQVEQPKEGAA